MNLFISACITCCYPLSSRTGGLPGVPRLGLWQRIPLRTRSAWPARGRSGSLLSITRGWAKRLAFQQLVPEFLQDLFQISSPICHPTTSDVPTTLSILSLEFCSCGTHLCSGFKHHLMHGSPHSIANSFFKALARLIMHLFPNACLGQVLYWLRQCFAVFMHLALIDMHTGRHSFGTSGCTAVVGSGGQSCRRR